MKNIISICSVLIFAFAVFMAQQTNAQDYLITFAGTGASTTVSSVEVENLSTGKTITLNGSDILHLTSVVGVPQFENSNPSAMRIYPNPMMDNSILALNPQEAGDAVITVYEMTGKTVAQIHNYIENGKQEFRLSGLKTGMYLINVTGNTFQYSDKILSSGQSVGNPRIEKVSNTNETNIEINAKKEFNQTQRTFDMYYTTGERLKFKAISGIYSTVKTDIPTGDKTLSFNFIPCTDGDNNNYPVVEIGGQIWMAENLKTRQFNDGTAIPFVKDSAAWVGLSTPGYCWYNNDSATYNASYGAFYNWYTVGTGKLCPAGWHVPSDLEWHALTLFLDPNATSTEFESNIAGGFLKEAGTANWLYPNTDATNKTGFTALPGGFRSVNLSFFAIGAIGFWWSSKESGTYHAWYRSVFYSLGSFYSSTYDLRNGHSIRCLRD